MYWVNTLVQDPVSPNLSDFPPQRQRHGHGFIFAGALSRGRPGRCASAKCLATWCPTRPPAMVEHSGRADGDWWEHGHGSITVKSYLSTIWKVVPGWPSIYQLFWCSSGERVVRLWPIELSKTFSTCLKMSEAYFDLSLLLELTAPKRAKQLRSQVTQNPGYLNSSGCT